MRSSYLGLKCKGGQVLSRFLPRDRVAESVLCSFIEVQLLVKPQCSTYRCILQQESELIFICWYCVWKSNQSYQANSDKACLSIQQIRSSCSGWRGCISKVLVLFLGSLLLSFDWTDIVEKINLQLEDTFTLYHVALFH